MPLLVKTLKTLDSNMMLRHTMEEIFNVRNIRYLNKVFAEQWIGSRELS